MTTTRINHRAHNHPNTLAARTACRKSLSGLTVALDRIDAHGRTTCRKCGSDNYETGSDMARTMGACTPRNCHWALENL